MLKSILALLLSFSLLLTLAACGKEPEVPETDSTAEIASQIQSEEETSLIPPEEESAVESAAESVTVDLPAPISSVVESEEDTQSQTTPLSSGTPSLSTTQIEQEVGPLPWLTQGDMVGDLLSWVRTNRQKSNEIVANIPLLAAAKNQTSLIVPSSKREDLVRYEIIVTDYADAYIHFFRTFPEGNQEAEWYGLTLYPYKGTSENWVDAIPSTTMWLGESEEEIRNRIKKATYQGKTYYYVDGDKGTESTDEFLASSWLLEDEYIIQITAHHLNSNKPWNPEWFDYFNFENVTL